MATLFGAVSNPPGYSKRSVENNPKDTPQTHIHVPVDLSRFKPQATFLSPKYAKSPALGNILKTPPDNTSTIISDLPRVPQRDQLRPKEPLLGYGTVVASESQADDLLNALPPIRRRVNESRVNESRVNESRVNENEVPEKEVFREVPGVENPLPAEERVRIAKRKADYRVKFGILRDAYPQMDIPEPTPEQPLEEIEVMYHQYVKRIHIDCSVNQNKLYLLILWLVIELVGVRYIGLPITGYTTSQEQYMKKYHMLLIELGERSYASSLGESLPVEVKLLGMALINGVIFLLVRLAANKLGVDGSSPVTEKLSKMVNDFLAQNSGQDVLKKAEEATADRPPSPPTTTTAEAPLNGLAGLLPQIMGLFAGNQPKPAQAPQMRRPTTFGNRSRTVGTTPSVH